MTISFTQRITVHPGVMVNVVDCESVILNLNNECYFGLDEIGTSMWTALTNFDSIQAAYEALLNEYDVDGNKLREDMTALIEQILERELVEFHGE